MHIPISQRSPFPIGDRVASIPEAAGILGVSPCTVKRLDKAGQLKILKLSPRRNGIRLSEIQRYLQVREAK